MGLNTTACSQLVRSERYDTSLESVVVTGVPLDDACVAILDLESLHPRAVGFRKGFKGSKYESMSMNKEVSMRV